MGTHPIFESDFDCLTDGMNRLWRFAISIVTIGLSIGYLLWGKKKKPIDNVARFKELTIIKLYSKIDECRSKFNRMMLAPSSGSRSNDGDGVGDESDSLVTDWDRSRESLNGISEDIHPDCFKPVPEIIRSYKNGEQFYKCEEIIVETEDGFLLTLHRIPNNGPPVLLQHGLLADSGNWVCGGPEHGLAFHLWRAGYDVYLGNSRGNPYSRRHTVLNPSKSEFWHWTFQDLAEFDFPAVIDKVLSINGREKLWYIGHSQGSLIAFAKLSEDSKRDLSPKLHGILALAPVFSLKYVKGPWKSLSPPVAKLINSKMISPDLEFLPQSRAGRWIATMASKSPGSMRRFGYRSARNLLLTWANFDPSRYVASRLEVFLAHTPAGTSFRNIIHFAQNVGSSVIRKLDYGPQLNEKKYGSLEAPTYDFTLIQTDLYLFVGSNDWLATQEDNLQFISKMMQKHTPTQSPKYKLETIWSDNDHLDFIWGRESHKNLYPKIISILNQASSSVS